MTDRDPVVDIANALVAKGQRVVRAGREFKAQCPAHEDRDPSLQIGYGDKGAVLKCHAGCTVEQIMAALELPMEALFADELGVSHRPSWKDPAPGADATYHYTDAHGNVLFRVERRPDKRFVQARPDHSRPGHWIFALGDVRRVPYRLPNVIGAVRDGETIWIVEGEKDVGRLETHGFVATCNPGGAGKFLREYAEWFQNANVVIVPDNDDVGRDHAVHVVDVLSTVARSVRVLQLDVPPHGDISDWLDMKEPLTVGWPAGEAGMLPRNGATLRMLAENLVPVVENRPSIFSAAELMEESYSDVIFAVNGVIAEGITLIAGSPKVGKSWLALSLGLAVAGGGMALDTIKVEQGRVLYLALEDTPRRLQRRLAVMLGEEPAPKLLDMTCDWPRFDAGGLDQLEAWIKDHDDTRLVLIDTLGKVKSQVSEAQTMYDADYAAMTQVKRIADHYGVAIAFIHHLRKADDPDPLMRVTGSVGLTGSVDAIVVLERKRGSDEGTLYVTGRDVEESYSLMQFDPERGRWIYLGPAERVQEQRLEDRVLEFAHEATEPFGPKELVATLDLKDGTAKWLLSEMAKRGQLKRVSRGQYVVADQPVNLRAVVPPFGGMDGDPLPSGVVSSDDAIAWERALHVVEEEFGGIDD